MLLKGSVPQSGDSPNSRGPWAWIPTLYLAEGIPYAVITGVSIVLYKNFKVSNRDIAFYTSLLGLPWVLKPMWSPLVDLLKTRRKWIWSTELLAAGGFVGASLAVLVGSYLLATFTLFMAMAFISASHDIAADGFYILANSEGEQSLFSGVRNTFYRVATICCQGPLLILVGWMQTRHGNLALSWWAAFLVVAVVMAALGAYHCVFLPRPERDIKGGPGKGLLAESIRTFDDFLGKPRVGLMIAFLLLYRLGEAQLMKMVQPFLLDARQKGGLELATGQVGLLYGTIGVSALLAGGITGGYLIARSGLRAWLWPMVIVMHAPDLVFVYLSRAQPHDLGTIGTCLAVEQFGYGFGFAAYMMYMIYIARERHQTAHYAICTGFMALGVLLPGMWSGWLQELLGYRSFFIWVLVSTIPGMVATALIPLDREFGRKRAAS